MNKTLKNLIFFNMGFFDEITKLFDEGELDKSFRVECFGTSAVLVSGYKKIKTLKETEIELKTKSNVNVIISGAKLYIKNLEESEVIIAGHILGVTYDHSRGGV